MKHFSIIAALWVAMALCACQQVSVDPKEIDLSKPYIPIFSPDGQKTGELDLSAKTRKTRKTHKTSNEQINHERRFKKLERHVEDGQCPRLIPTFMRKLEDPKHPDYEMTVFFMARCYQKSGEDDKARAFIQDHLDGIKPNSKMGERILRLLIDMKRSDDQAAAPSRQAVPMQP